MSNMEKIINRHFCCTCDEMYNNRKITDPNCVLCNNEEAIKDTMREYLHSFREWAEDECGVGYHDMVWQEWDDME